MPGRPFSDLHKKDWCNCFVTHYVTCFVSASFYSIRWLLKGGYHLPMFKPSLLHACQKKWWVIWVTIFCLGALRIFIALLPVPWVGLDFRYWLILNHLERDLNWTGQSHCCARSREAQIDVQERHYCMHQLDEWGRGWTHFLFPLNSSWLFHDLNFLIRCNMSAGQNVRWLVFCNFPH